LQLTINNKTYTDNSKEASLNCVFVVSKLNEHFIEDAKNNGCVEFIQAKNLKKYIDISLVKIIGITGTNGKTTTASAIYSFLLSLGYKAALQGTRGFFINGKKVEEYTLTTPVQLANFAHTLKAIKNNCDFFVMEVSSHAIDQKRIEGLEFALKVHTNITRDHLDYHKSIEEYVNVKNSFFQDKSKKLINKDDEKVKFNTKNAFTYALQKCATYKVDTYSFENDMSVIFSKAQKKYSFSSSTMGVFNIYNLLAAIASVELVTNKSLKSICEVVKNFAGISGRMELVSNNPLIIIDFAHTPDGMKNVYRSFNHKDIITVFGAGGNRDKDKRALMGQIATKFAKSIILTSDNPRLEDPNSILEDICLGIKNKNNLIIQVNRKKAIEQAIKMGKNNLNSVVLILGKGDEPYQIIGNKKFPLNDKEEVLKHIN